MTLVEVHPPFAEFWSELVQTATEQIHKVAMVFFMLVVGGIKTALLKDTVVQPLKAELNEDLMSGNIGWRVRYYQVKHLGKLFYVGKQ